VNQIETLGFKIKNSRRSRSASYFAGDQISQHAQTCLTDPLSLVCHAPCMDTRHELQQAMWEVIAEMERARLQGADDQARRLEQIAWRLVGVIEGMP
jgi:hypothetical protein